jgi:hypothetical protein
VSYENTIGNQPGQAVDSHSVRPPHTTTVPSTDGHIDEARILGGTVTPRATSGRDSLLRVSLVQQLLPRVQMDMLH